MRFSPGCDYLVYYICPMIVRTTIPVPITYHHNHNHEDDIQDYVPYHPNQFLVVALLFGSSL